MFGGGDHQHAIAGRQARRKEVRHHVEQVAI
jgi:hypothetical protein